MNESAKDPVFNPPYIAFKTLTGLLDRMASEEPPDRIDKSYLDNFSGGYQTQVLAALVALGLVEAGGGLSQTLKRLVAADGPERKRVMADLIRDLYAPVLGRGQNATQAQLLEAFAELAPKVAGDTRRKAVAFLLNSCSFAGIPVSRHWKTPPAAASPKPKTKKEQQTDDSEEDETAVDEASATNLKQLELRSGGVMTIGLTVDLFRLSKIDREFVFKIVDEMTAYEEALPLTPTADTEVDT